MVLETYMKLCMTEPYFQKKKKKFPPNFLGQNNGSKTGFFGFIEKFGH